MISITPDELAAHGTTWLPVLATWLYRFGSVHFTALVLMALTGVRELHASAEEGAEKSSWYGSENVFRTVNILRFKMLIGWIVGFGLAGATDVAVLAKPSTNMMASMFVLDAVAVIALAALVGEVVRTIWRWSNVLQQRRIEAYKAMRTASDNEHRAVVVSLRGSGSP